MSAFGDAVGDEMLEGGGYAFVISVVQGTGAAHHAGGHPAGQVDIFAIGLLDAGPTGFAGQVDDRSIADVPALGAQFGGDDAAGLFHQGRVPGRGQANAGREDGGADGHVAVRGFFREDDGDAEAAVLDGIALQGIVRFGGQGRIQAVLQGFPRPRVRPERGPQHTAVLFVDKLVEHFRLLDLAFGFLVHRPPERADDLADFLLRCHAGEQVGRALFGATGLVLIDFRMIAAGGGKREHRRQGDEFGKWF